MMIRNLAAELHIPREVIERLEPVPEAKPYLKGLCSESYEAAATAVHEAIGEDENGYRILSAMLEAALLAREEYARRGIPDDIYISTMGCFPRFIGEHKESFGTYGFDHWWWTGRQTSLRLFRIGPLEYELIREGVDNLISVHIPSDADLSDGAVDNSLLTARAFIHKFFPAYGEAEFICHSWLLSPALGELLPADSRINRFRRRFEVISVDEDADDYKLWVYKDKRLSIEEFPERTTLQRKMKAYLSAGGKVGSARGIIREK